MRSRFRRVLATGVGILALGGCGEFQPPAPLPYAPAANLASALEGKPKVQAQLGKLISGLFGPNTEEMRVPPGAPLPEGGARLASLVVLNDADPSSAAPLVFEADGSGKSIRGGLSLYREHCMHCHGASGDGAGPTALFLWPRPRDFRSGVFKFTSTEGTGADSKPTRDDLVRTLRDGVDNTSMSPFGAVLNPSEIEQIVDYVIFLSLRGEVETSLVTLGQEIEDDAAETELSEDLAQEAIDLVFGRWTGSAERVVVPPTERVPPTAESVARGKQFYLGEKGVQCFTCHGLDGMGNGDSFVDYRSFVKAMFQGTPGPDQLEQLKQHAEKDNKKWADDWGQPLRPSNLMLGRYKGGRRPLDLYWRIAKGINGTPMPAHFSSGGGSLLTSDEIWDVVNFVLALPDQRDLLQDARPVEIAPVEAAGLVVPHETSGTPAAARSAP